MSEISTTLAEQAEVHSMEMSWRTGISYAAAFLLLLGTGFAGGMTYQAVLSQVGMTEIQVKLDNARRQLKYEDLTEIAWNEHDKQIAALLSARGRQIQYHDESNKCVHLRQNILSALAQVRQPRSREYEKDEKKRIASLDQEMVRNLQQLKEHRCD